MDSTEIQGILYLVNGLVALLILVIFIRAAMSIGKIEKHAASILAEIRLARHAKELETTDKPSAG